MIESAKVKVNTTTKARTTADKASSKEESELAAIYPKNRKKTTEVARKPSTKALKSQWNKEEVVRDYRIGFQSRQASLLGRREVLSGKAKFGIFGDGKEVAQLAMARVFRKGDFRSGYYRDQTFMFALGMSDVQKFFAQLYAHTDVEAEPASAGRSMNGHFATRSLNPDGSWKVLADQYNSSADISPTGSQMPRLVGLGYASKLYREVEELRRFTQFSHNGDEVAFGTIGNASSAEGMFWEAINAVGVLGAPVVMSIWDDGYGISVPNKHQITKENIGEVLSGFQRKPGLDSGFDIHTVRGWDYPALLETYRRAADAARLEHAPQIIHVTEVTQPQGHSTSGSHERYKSKERLEWEIEFDGLSRMRNWIIAEGIASEKELDAYEKEDAELVRQWKEAAWDAYISPIRAEVAAAVAIMDNVATVSSRSSEITTIRNDLSGLREPFRRDVMAAIHKSLLALRSENLPQQQELIRLKNSINERCSDYYSGNLHSESAEAAKNAPIIAAKYSQNAPMINGSDIMNACFDAAFARDPRILAFGEDLGQLGDVNQGFIGLQKKYGELRVADTGIRETTILGQAIGLAMRGLRPIAEIQYLDYLLYALQIMSDDLATVQWRTKSGQKAPVIIRTRGHRLEGIWHAGSPMAGIINLVRGIYVCVPRNMTQAAGFYNLLLRSDEPALIIEPLNGYRLKEKLPDNPGDFTVALGSPEILREGSDITLATYGSCCRLALDAAEMLAQTGISVEVIDAQTLLPFDVKGEISRSLQKTNRILFLDEDAPGGATAYMLQQVIEMQGGYKFLDAEPRTLSAKPHRPAYGTDGNYWSKPDVEHIFERVYDVMHESNPRKYPIFYR